MHFKKHGVSRSIRGFFCGFYARHAIAQRGTRRRQAEPSAGRMLPAGRDTAPPAPAPTPPRQTNPLHNHPPRHPPTRVQVRVAVELPYVGRPRCGHKVAEKAVDRVLSVLVAEGVCVEAAQRGQHVPAWGEGGDGWVGVGVGVGVGWGRGGLGMR
jgi:hypothetical protein